MEKLAYYKQSVFIWATGLLRATPLRHIITQYYYYRAFVIAIVCVRKGLHAYRQRSKGGSQLSGYNVHNALCNIMLAQYTCNPFMVSPTLTPPLKLAATCGMYSVHSALPFVCHMRLLDFTLCVFWIEAYMCSVPVPRS